MGQKLLWTGLVLIMAIPVLLGMLGLGGGSVFAAAGAVVMVVGLIALLLDR